MGDMGVEWEIQEHSSSSSEESKSKVKWILDKGLNIGKKIVITGVVISCAPLVLPSLVVISALGFALSVPSGILLSSYLCTKKVMSMLLPIRPDYPLVFEGTEEEKEEFGDGYRGKVFENEYQDLEDKEDWSAREEGYEEDVGEHIDKAGAEEEPLTNRAEPEQPLDQANVAEGAKLGNENVLERESGENFPSVETRKEEIKESEDGKKVDVTQEMAQASDTKGTSAGNRDEKDISDTKTIINDNETNRKSAKKRKGNKKQDGGMAHEELQKKKEEEKVVHPTNVEARDTSEFLGSEEAPESKQTAATPTGKKVEVSEEVIWERLDALRAIVGYKASPHRTYVGELRALYMFTGVELPASFKDPCDLVEVNDKLGFLMSIVGVK